MSEALERVIAEQQAEIDRLKALYEGTCKHWETHNKRYENLALAAFMALDNESPEMHFHLKRTLMAQGWCPNCECNPCECEDQYD